MGFVNGSVCVERPTEDKVLSMNPEIHTEMLETWEILVLYYELSLLEIFIYIYLL